MSDSRVPAWRWSRENSPPPRIPVPGRGSVPTAKCLCQTLDKLPFFQTLPREEFLPSRIPKGLETIEEPEALPSPWLGTFSRPVLTTQCQMARGQDDGELAEVKCPAVQFPLPPCGRPTPPFLCTFSSHQTLESGFPPWSLCLYFLGSFPPSTGCFHLLPTPIDTPLEGVPSPPGLSHVPD